MKEGFHLPQEESSLPRGVRISQEEVYPSAEGSSSSAGRSPSFQRRNFVFRRRKFILSWREFIFRRRESILPKEEAHLSQEEVHLSLQGVHLPQEGVHICRREFIFAGGSSSLAGGRNPSEREQIDLTEAFQMYKIDRKLKRFNSNMIRGVPYRQKR